MGRSGTIKIPRGRKKEYMKKYRLKKWVKDTLIAIAVIGVLVLLAIISKAQYKGAVEDCVAGGNARVFCENALR